MIALRRYEPDRLEVAMSALNASVLWCGVTGAVPDTSGPEFTTSSVSERFHECIDDAVCLPLLAQQGREFGCNGCSIVELIIAGSYRMVPHSSKRKLQWTERDLLFNAHEYASRRGIMRMPQQEDHEVFLSLREWRNVPHGIFEPEWLFSEAFDGRLLLLPFFHRAQSGIDSAVDVTLALHMDASRLSNLDLIAKTWGGPISVVIIVCVAYFYQSFKYQYHSIDVYFADSLKTQIPPLSLSCRCFRHRPQSLVTPTFISPASHIHQSTIQSMCVAFRV
jgi:hypothetical protein